MNEEILKKLESKTDIKSKYRDLIFYKSSDSPWLSLMMVIEKPEKKCKLSATIIKSTKEEFEFVSNDDTPSNEFIIKAYIRGNAYSDGESDNYSHELFDLIDGIEVAKRLYKNLIIDDDINYVDMPNENYGIHLAAKFPDYFKRIETYYDNRINIGEYMSNVYTNMNIISNDSSVENAIILNKKKSRVKMVSSSGIKMYSNNVKIPRYGVLKVFGYIVTNEFSLYLRNELETALVKYNLNSHKFRVECKDEVGYSLKFKSKRNYDFDD